MPSMWLSDSQSMHITLNPFAHAEHTPALTCFFGNVEVGVAFCSGGGYDHEDHLSKQVPPLTSSFRRLIPDWRRHHVF